jgi:hypothetical protein
MQRELTYQVSFERLKRLSRSARRQVFPGMRWVCFLVGVLCSVAFFAIIDNSDALHSWFTDKLAIPYGVQLLLVGDFLIFAACMWLVCRWQVGRVRSRVDSGAMIRMTQDDGGLRFATANVEHYLKWPGINQVLLEHDGVVVSHGILFFLIPDKAFTSASDRLAFIREVYGRLGEKARASSERYLRSVLNEAVQ